ncbi:MAG: PDDEXK nuclease domain-containing protein [Bacteroidales bacterium]|nr:PDDEXK nuclease domain-containing protein [Bacteroidales bacterium]
MLQDSGFLKSNSIENLTDSIYELHNFFKTYAVQQVNNALTLRNWMIGFYLIEYEQNGKDRATYGEKTLKVLSEKIASKGLKGFSDRNLRLYRQFCLEYTEIWQFILAKFENADNQMIAIWQSEIAKSKIVLAIDIKKNEKSDISSLITKLSYTHFIELLSVEKGLKRSFYEIQTVKNNWTVSQLKRYINSMLYERIGLSKNKDLLLAKLKNENLMKADDLIKNPFVFEFLEFPEKAEYFESDLEQAITNNLQHFLIELGRGFCFEARQKRISFNNKHYKIDLVFYHRILRCHVLIDLKIGEFDHSDAGQMNMYLNYYKENEMSELDNPPIGIILCSYKDNALVHYATGGLSQEVFVSRYLLQMPDEKQLKQIITNELNNLSKFPNSKDL